MKTSCVTLFLKDPLDSLVIFRADDVSVDILVTHFIICLAQVNDQINKILKVYNYIESWFKNSYKQYGINLYYNSCYCRSSYHAVCLRFCFVNLLIKYS